MAHLVPAEAARETARDGATEAAVGVGVRIGVLGLIGVGVLGVGSGLREG